MIRFGSCKVPRMNQALSILTGVRIGELMLEKIYGLFVGTDTTVRTAARVEGGGGGTPYNGLYGEASPERGTFFTLQVYERVGISRVELYKRVGKSVI